MLTSTVRPADAPGKNILPFAAVPHDLVGDRRLTATDVRLAAVLLRYARQKDYCWPSTDRLALDLEVCKRTVQYSLSRFKKTGWVAERPHGNPTGRVLVLVWRPSGANRCTGGVQTVAPAPSPVRVHAVAPEGRGEEKKNARAPQKVEDLGPIFTEWASLPASNGLRRVGLFALAVRARQGDPIPSGQTSPAPTEVPASGPVPADAETPDAPKERELVSPPPEAGATPEPEPAPGPVETPGPRDEAGPAPATGPGTQAAPEAAPERCSGAPGQRPAPGPGRSGPCPPTTAPASDPSPAAAPRPRATGGPDRPGRGRPGRRGGPRPLGDALGRLFRRE